jgi:hypothetical protein
MRNADHSSRGFYGLTLSLIVIIALVTTFLMYTSFNAMERARSLEAAQQKGTATTMAGLPPFANRDFDVIVTPPIVTVPEDGGSVNVLVELRATNLGSSQTLLFETHASISTYTANFNSSSVTLNPGTSAWLQLSLTIPNGVQKGTYPLSIIAKGGTTQGGGWLVINVGPPTNPPPP